MIKAHEIQGCLALENAFNRVGLDHVVLVKIATTVVVSSLLHLTREQMLNAVSLAWVDGQSLRTYRHAPNTGSRKSWAAGDATSRGVHLALMAERGEMGYPTALTAPTWGFYDASFRGERFRFQRTYGSYVMENVLFKLHYPAEFHAQSAVEAAMKIHHHLVREGCSHEDIETITIFTHQACLRIIDKSGPLTCPADRDHCIQYMVAIPLIHGRLSAADYEDDVANDPKIDQLRVRMRCVENPQFSADYLNPEKRSIANTVEARLTNGSIICETVEYPIGHRTRRAEGLPFLKDKFERHLGGRFSRQRRELIQEVVWNHEHFNSVPVSAFVDLFV
jgi:2-methylcitrate dehydratase